MTPVFLPRTHVPHLITRKNSKQITRERCPTKYLTTILMLSRSSKTRTVWRVVRTKRSPRRQGS